jgi:hypothetical protein
MENENQDDITIELIEEDIPAPEASEKSEPQDDTEETTDESAEDSVTAKQAEIRENLKKAQYAEYLRVKTLRDEAKTLRKKQLENLDEEDEGVRLISAKIEDATAPVVSIIEQQKEELFTECLLDFASEHPMSDALAEKVIQTYKTLSSSSGLNAKAVMRDLAKSYAAETYDDQEIIEKKAIKANMNTAKASVGITKSNGSGAGINTVIQIPAQDYRILKDAGMSDEAIKNHYKNKQKT